MFCVLSVSSADGGPRPIAGCHKILALLLSHLSGGVESRTNFRRWISPLFGPKLYITKTLERSVLDLKFKLDSMLTQPTAVLREQSSKKNFPSSSSIWLTTLFCVTKSVYATINSWVERTLWVHEALAICPLPYLSKVTSGLLSLDTSSGISSLDRQLWQLWHPPTDRQCKLGPSIGNSLLPEQLQGQLRDW